MGISLYIGKKHTKVTFISQYNYDVKINELW